MEEAARPDYPEPDNYIQNVLIPGLTRAIDNGAKAIFLQHEARKWAAAEAKLEAWASRDDGAPHPFSPELSAFQISIIRNRIDSELETLREAIRDSIAKAERN